MGNGNAKATTPVTLDMIRDAQLVQIIPGASTPAAPITSASLWQDTPVVLYIVRRPGCPLCREHALDLCKVAPQFSELGFSMVAVVHEELGADIFAKDFFADGKVYFDEKKAFYESLGSRWLGLTGLLYPSVHKNAKRAKGKSVEGNWEGEGRLLGGLLVVKQGEGGVAFEHREKVFGDHASVDDILAACRVAAGKPPSDVKFSPSRKTVNPDNHVCGIDSCAAPTKA